MEDHEIPTDAPSDWQPITDKAVLARLGKLGEEACELSAILFRCIIQGVDEREPKTGKLNREALEDEIADVDALMLLAMRYFRLDIQRIRQRSAMKRNYKQPWYDALDKLPKEGKPVHIFDRPDGWYFEDETGNLNGPYRNKEVAYAHLALYCDYLKHGPSVHPVQQGYIGKTGEQ